MVRFWNISLQIHLNCHNSSILTPRFSCHHLKFGHHHVGPADMKVYPVPYLHKSFHHQRFFQVIHKRSVLVPSNKNNFHLKSAHDLRSLENKPGRPKFVVRGFSAFSKSLFSSRLILWTLSMSQEERQPLKVSHCLAAASAPSMEWLAWSLAT